jgi:carboxylesterase
MKLSTRKIFIIIFTFFFGWIFLFIHKRKQFKSKPHPLKTFYDAERRIKNIQEREKAFVRQEGRSVFLSHGKKTDCCIILLHGYTNSPRQFNKLGRQFFEQGNNVLIPRMPYHGLLDILTKEHAKLSVSAMINYADSVIDIGQALGNKIILIGISAGGIIAGWSALQRREVCQSVLIAPVFGFAGFPQILMKPLMRMLLTLPNFFRWWDAEKKADSWSLHHVYPRYSSRALANLLSLGFEVRRLLKKRNTKTADITVITNGSDETVNNKSIYSMTRLWKKKKPGGVKTYEFSAVLGLDHDIIDPEHGNEQIGLVYPVILDLVSSDNIN